MKEIVNPDSKAMFDSSQDISQMTAFDVSEITECFCPKIEEQQIVNNQSADEDSYPSTYVAREKRSQEVNSIGELITSYTRKYVPLIWF